MFEYGRPAGQPSDGASPTPKPVRPVLPSAAMALDAVLRRKTIVLACVGLGAACGWAATKVITPRYVATTQIYIDPGSVPGAEKDALAPGQDSTGFINYVESQGLIITSRQVLQNVVANEKLATDPEFAGSSRGFLFAAKPPSETDLTDSAISALGARIQIRRPERTFVIDLSASDKNPDKAARLANATARAYIQVLASMQKDAAGRAEASLGERLVALRERVITAENAVETYKADNGLIGARDQLVGEQQLKELTSELTAARAKEADARAQIDQIEANKRWSAANVAALASQLNSPALAALRTQQASARQRLADLEAELGPRHPQVIDAKARASSADRAVEDELTRTAQSQRIEYQRAKQIEQTVSKQLDALKSETASDGERSVGLRDLERQADAARGVYELFVTRSRETGEIQQIEPSRTHVISEATAPNHRVFPPGAAVLAAVGALVGGLVGLLIALWRQGLLSLSPVTRRPDEDVATPQKQPAASLGEFVISRRTKLELSRWPQKTDNLDLTGLGVPAAASAQDLAEFDAMLAALPNFVGDLKRPVIVAVVGSNRAYARIGLSLNLALAAAARGARVALLDAAERNAGLTSAVEPAPRARNARKIPVRRTIQDVLLAIPPASDPNGLRYRPADMLAQFAEQRVGLVICDGPNLDRFREDRVLDRIDVVFVARDSGDPDAARAEWDSLETFGLADRAFAVRFNPRLNEERKRA